MKRSIVQIDKDKCNGCGLCVDACHEGAIELIDGKAVLVSDVYCDGLGACLGKCPVDAITIDERDADAFDPEAVAARQSRHAPAPAAAGCPGMRALAFADSGPEQAEQPSGSTPSQLRQWPLQLHLVPVQAPYWADAHLLVSADCVAHAYGAFHHDLLRGNQLIIACPKLDDTSGYVEKLAAIIEHNDIRSLTVAHMEVPCCTGLIRIAEAALSRSGKTIPFETVKLGIRGSILERRSHTARA